MKLRLGFVSNSSSASFTLFLSVGEQQTPEDAVRRYVAELARHSRGPLDSFFYEFKRGLPGAMSDNPDYPWNVDAPKADTAPEAGAGASDIEAPEDPLRACSLDALVRFLMPESGALNPTDLSSWIASLDERLGSRRAMMRSQMRRRRLRRLYGRRGDGSDSDGRLDITPDEDSDDRRLLAYAKKLAETRPGGWQVLQTGLNSYRDYYDPKEDPADNLAADALYEAAGSMHRVRAGGSVAYVIQHNN
eukprot:m51a1_g10459 hypothetical protein (247) ;mRNA; f:31838-32857